MSRYHCKRFIMLMLLTLFPMASQAQTDKRMESPVMAIKPFPLHQVRLTEGRLLDALNTNRKYLDALPPDLLLAPYLKTAGLPAKSGMPGGWERNIPGTMLGHYLTALALMHAQTGDEALKERGAYIVNELARVQEAMGGEYVAGFPESILDTAETDRAPFVVFYVMHKYLAGLLDQYLLCGNEQALDVLEGMAAYLVKRTAKLSDKQMGEMLDRTEEGGMCDTLWSLFEITGKPEHKALAQKFEKRSFLDGLAEGNDNLTGRHGNMHIPLAIGAARHYEATGDEAYRLMTEFFWRQVVDARSFATGGSTTGEVWCAPHELALSRSSDTQESCTTYNMLKVTRHLFNWTGDPAYADFYERAFMNGILGTQEPGSGMLQYFTPQINGYQRTFGYPFDSFWCCYGTGIESYSKLGNSIYFHDNQSIYVNLFFGSRVKWPEKGLTLEQTTDFPREQATHLLIQTDEPVDMALMLRVPYWTADGVSIKVNGKPVEQNARPCSYLRLERTWNDGDRVDMEMPMSLHAWTMPDDPQMITVMYGPLVLAGVIPEPGGKNLESRFFQDNVPTAQPYADEMMQAWYFLADTPDDLSWLKPIDGESMVFRTADQPFDITFMPFNLVVNQRYGLNWLVLPKGSDRQKMMDKENDALSFLRALRAFESPSALDGLRAEYERLINNPSLIDFHQDMARCLGRIEKQTGHTERIAPLMKSMTTPFILEEDAEEVWSIIGRPEASYSVVSPLLAKWLLGSSATRKAERDGRIGIITDHRHLKNIISFKLPNYSPLKGFGQAVEINIDYYDSGTPGSKFLLEYDATDKMSDGDGVYTTETVVKTGEKGWHTAKLVCPNAHFQNRQVWGSDFRINSMADDDECIAAITLSASHVSEVHEKN